MEDAKKNILTRVAQGSLSPDQAVLELDDLERRKREAETRESPATDANTPVGRVRLEGNFGRVRIVGDPNVREAVAQGYHVARREGDVLIIEGNVRGEDLWGLGFAFNRRGGWARSGRTPWSGEELQVAMNPDLPLDVDLLAGSLNVHGVRGRMRISVTAGSAQLDDVVGPLDLFVASGSIRANGVINQGASRIRCEMGNVRLRLERGSSVQISARATMGRVSLPGPVGVSSGRWGLSGDTQTATVGAGAATLEVETSMGNVAVEAA